MPFDPLTIGIEVNQDKAGAQGLIELLKQYGDSLNRELHFLWEERTASALGLQGLPAYQLVNKVDLYLVAGGDGSMLKTVREIYPAQTPILGVNIGSLGFLTSLAEDEVLTTLPLLSSKEYLRHSPRMALEATVYCQGEETTIPCALNDVVVSRGEESRLVRLQVRIGDYVVTEYVADGLVVFTPTGSTAYSLSADGPIVSPEARVLGITPICSHSLTHRSLIVGVDQPIRIEVPPQDSPLIVQLDGKNEGKLQGGDWLEIRPAPFPVLLAYTPQRDFYSLLRTKLKWSGASI